MRAARLALGAREGAEVVAEETRPPAVTKDAGPAPAGPSDTDAPVRTAASGDAGTAATAGSTDVAGRGP